MDLTKEEIMREGAAFAEKHAERFRKEQEELTAQKDEIVKKFWTETEEPAILEQIDELWNESIRRREALGQEYLRTHTNLVRGRIMTPEVLAEEEIQKQLFFRYCKIKRQSSEEKNKK